MKKYIALLLALVMLLGVMLTACGEDAPDAEKSGGKEPEKKETVTIYIPATVTASDGEGTTLYTMNTEFEEGWQNKETFEVRNTCSGDVENQVASVIYGDKITKAVYEDGNLDRMEMEYNDRGQVIKQTLYFREDVESNAAQKQVTTSVYDDRGLLQSQSVQIHMLDGEDTQGFEMSYTYEETGEGYVGTGVDSANSGLKYVVVYDKEGRQLSSTVYVSDLEQSRTEYTYDEHGNQTCVEIYSGKVVLNETKTTYTAVEVSEETAERLPQFRRED